MRQHKSDVREFPAKAVHILGVVIVNVDNHIQLIRQLHGIRKCLSFVSVAAGIAAQLPDPDDIQIIMASAQLIQCCFVKIRVDRELKDAANLLLSLHPDLTVEGDTVILKNTAMRMRRQILTLLLNMDFDVLRVEQKRVTLSEIYAETVQ